MPFTLTTPNKDIAEEALRRAEKLNKGCKFTVPELFLDWNMFTDPIKALNIGKEFQSLVFSLSSGIVDTTPGSKSTHIYERI